MPAPRWLKPWMVALALTLVAVAGATGVYFGSQVQHRRDRSDIVEWQARAQPALAATKTWLDALTGSPGNAGAVDAETALAEARAELRALTTPGILLDVRDAYVEAIVRGLRAADAVLAGDASSGKRLALDAIARMDAARALLQRLRCRARVPECRSVP